MRTDNMFYFLADREEVFKMAGCGSGSKKKKTTTGSSKKKK